MEKKFWDKYLDQNGNRKSTNMASKINNINHTDKA